MANLEDEIHKSDANGTHVVDDKNFGEKLFERFNKSTDFIYTFTKVDAIVFAGTTLAAGGLFVYENIKQNIPLDGIAMAAVGSGMIAACVSRYIGSIVGSKKAKNNEKNALANDVKYMQQYCEATTASEGKRVLTAAIENLKNYPLKDRMHAYERLSRLSAGFQDLIDIADTEIRYLMIEHPELGCSNPPPDNYELSLTPKFRTYNL